MRINLTIILMAIMLQVSAGSYAQKISINRVNTSLNEVIKEIRKQSGYDFIYTNPQMRMAKPVTLQVVEKPLLEVLKICFDQQPFTYTIEDKTIIIKNKPAEALASNMQWAAVVTGTVVDENGKPLSGASVKIKGDETRGVMTDKNGFFRATVPSYNVVLVISYIGYKTQEIKIKPNQEPLTVKLEVETKDMETVVVNTGMFKKADKSFTGASTTVTAKELAEFGNRNLITSLRNIDPAFNIIESNAFGSNPNRLPEIQIRGNSSIPNVNELRDQTRADLNTPLIIMDGFTSTLQRLYDMNENEVESITLLKDAAATAIYGSRGSNGVVVIITKSPREGKLRLTFRSDINIEAPDLSDYSLLKAREKLDLELKAGYYNSPRAETDLPLKRYYNYLLNEVNSGVETDWMAIPLRSGIGQRHNLRLEGGDRSFRYSASAQINNIQGVMKGSSRNTFNGTITLAYTYDNVRLRNNLQILEGKSNESPYGAFSDYSKMNPYWRPYDEQGKVIKLMGDPGNLDFQGLWIPLPTNPLYNATLNVFDKSATSTLINNTSVEWNILKELVLRGQIGLTKTNIQTDAFRPADHTAFANYSVDDFFRKGDYNYGTTNSFGYDAALNLQYSKNFGSNHILSGGVNIDVNQNKSSVYGFKAEGFPNQQFDFISMGLQYAKDGKPTGTEGLTRSIGATASANYIYANRYFVDASFRTDGSSQFGANKRFAPFWSAGIGWNLHNEKFLEDNKFINRLKLRGSVGTTGARNFNPYQAMSTYRYYTDQRYFNWMGAQLLGLGNEDLQWQQTLKYNIGMDAEFLNSRLRIRTDYYIETTNDLVSSINLPASNGFPSYVENIGRMRNRGYELNATGFLIPNQNGFTWTVSAALLHNKNKVLETSKALKDAQSITLNGNTLPGTLYMEGYSSNDIWVVPSLGIDPSTGKELFLGADGLPTYTWLASNIRSVGSSDPKVFGNFSTMVRYKGFAVNASFRYSLGGKQYNSTLVNKVESSDYKYNVDSRVYDSRWQKPGDITAFKALLITTPTYKTSRFVQDENTLVLQNVNFQYEVRSKTFLKKLRLEALNFTANVAEPMYLSTIRRERGTDYPFSRQFSFSVNATF